LHLDRLAEKKAMHRKIPETFYNTTGCGVVLNGVPRFAIATNSLKNKYTFTADVYKLLSLTLNL
jgi:hypothetical protein